MISSMGGVALLIYSHIRAQGEKMGQIVTKCIMSQNKKSITYLFRYILKSCMNTDGGTK